MTLAAKRLTLPRSAPRTPRRVVRLARAAAPARAASPALVRELFRLALIIAEEWRLHSGELAALLGTSPRTLARWKAAREIESPTPDVVDRLQLTLWIYEDLLALAGSEEGARRLLRAERREAGPVPRQAWLARMTTGRLLELAGAQRELHAHVMG